MRKITGLCLLGGVVLVAACSSDGGGGDDDLFPPKPECEGDPIVAFMGKQPQVISKLAIGTKDDGFDLDHDGLPDNKLSGISGIGQAPIDDAMANYEIVIPFEFFSLEDAAPDSCVKFAVYLGTYVRDNDTDGKRPYILKGDCNDLDPAIKPGAREVAGNFVDDNCNGKADEASQTVDSTDTVDHDGDGISMAQDDCDDRVGMGMAVHPGATEICGDGLDNDCDGVADRTANPNGPAICSPFDGANPADIPLDPMSLVDGQPAIIFNSGSIVDEPFRDGSGTGPVLHAGPSLFRVTLPVTNDIKLELRISGATIEAQVVKTGEFITLKNARLGGVIDAVTADTIRGLTVEMIGLTPEASLLDATFANLLGPLLSLPKASASVLEKYAGCRTPDIDVDGDGLEAFCDSCASPTPEQAANCPVDAGGFPVDPKTVDVCIDGDGTEIKDVLGSDGAVIMHCSEAVKGEKKRFVDGISVELNFDTTQVKSLKPPT